MIIQPIVEGQGEEAAVPLLLRRLRDEAQAWHVQIARPHRRKRTQFVRKDDLQTIVRVAAKAIDCAGILVLFDADDDCPKERVGELEAWAQEASGGIPVAVVMANREYEAWFLGGIESLRGVAGVRADATSHPDPESPRGAKGELEERMEPNATYSPTVDQAPLTARLDLEQAHRACRSFRRLVRAFGGLLSASGALTVQWPPAEWVR